MSDRKLSSWFYPASTGDPGRDRNARTLQFSCFLLAFAVGAVLIVSAIEREWQTTPLLIFAMAGFVAAAIVNRAGRSDWAGRTTFLIVLLSAILLVFRAHDGFRSHSMLLFPGLLLISLMMLDRTSYVTTAGIVLAVVVALGIAIKHGFTLATPPVRTTYDSIFYVALNLLVIAIIGSRIARDTQRNVFDLRAGIDRLSAANLELVQIREHLQQSEERLKSAQRLTHVGSWHWNLAANQVVCSEECKRIFGQPEDYMPSLEGLLQIITPSERARVASEIQRGIEEKSGCSTEFPIVRPNGELRMVTFNSQVVLDEEGSPRHIFGACQDVTDDRRAQEEAHARQKLESVGTLAGGIAHDFNNLLGAVQAQAELGLSELDAGSSCKEELKSISEVAMRGSEIVRQLMIYAGKESGAVGPVDLSKIVDEMLSLLKVSVTKHAAIEAHLDHDLAAIRASAGQLRQIVMNLITNASDAIGDQDGVIRVVTRHVTLKRESGTKSSPRLPDGEYLQLEVSDTGRGISPEKQARVFDPFFTTKSTGRGLGLAVVQGIVRSLGGAIHFASEPGRGTTFQVLLPPEKTRADASGQVISGDGQMAVPFPHVTVLVVEDEDLLRQGIVKMLRKNGFEVFEASEGSSAIKLLHADGGKIDVILLDMTMPGASSHEIIAKAVIAKPDIKVILTSAFSQEMITSSMSSAQNHSFIRKPFQFEDLLRMLRSLLSS